MKKSLTPKSMKPIRTNVAEGSDGRETAPGGVRAAPTKAAIVNRLIEWRSALCERGVASAALFGAGAPDSRIILPVEINGSRCRGSQFIGIRREPVEGFGYPVSLATRDGPSCGIYENCSPEPNPGS